MKLTIIETGRPPEPIVRDFPGYPVMIEALLRPHVPALSLNVVSVIDGDDLPSLDTIEAVLVTGSPAGVYDPLGWIEPLKAWIRGAGQRAIPQVGICFGHQIMAEAFGGHAHKAPQGWGLGRHAYDVECQEAWMQGAHPTGPLNLAVSIKTKFWLLPLRHAF
jgi:GMP synthase-like glutamine amidotransferase